ncbi:histidine triad nucleotide-binding protein [Campylobacter blaseri]|uniref:HIT family protein n=1 Tax=Campylobacter blaseri TaxID=2042961 RepID=A0A2P8QYK1_9BACT|nr:HIT family protein [Campylobacter blaseri]PSM51335.1 HIT family protein [Campylobacter blaseri]PSM52479.1 HIT family protein [Campylobacter blaseri]QKF86190.1 histidine triad nucleotide-binding protein [Campylobacter blaseri]
MIFEDNLIFIEKEDSEIPWVKIFSKKGYKELSDCDKKTRDRLFEVMLIVEKTMLKYYKPDKINIASFANYVPRVHIHIMARFKSDSFFPEPMWGKKQRDGNLNLPNFDGFIELLLSNLKS